MMDNTDSSSIGHKEAGSLTENNSKDSNLAHSKITCVGIGIDGSSNNRSNNNDATNTNTNINSSIDQVLADDDEERTLDLHSVPKKRPSVLHVNVAKRKKSLRRLMRRLSSDSNFTGIHSNGRIRSSRSRSISSDEVSVTELRSKIDAIESSLEKMQDDGDDSFVQQLGDDDLHLVEAISKFVDNSDGESDDDDDDDGDDDESACSSGAIDMEDTVTKIRVLLGVLKTTEWESMRSIQSQSSDINLMDSRNCSRRNSNYTEVNIDDRSNDDRLAEKLEHTSHNGILETKSAVEILRNASVLPCSLILLKSHLKKEEEKLKMDLEKRFMESAGSGAGAGAGAASSNNGKSTTMKVTGRNSIFREKGGEPRENIAATTSQRRSSYFRRGILSMLSKDSLDDGASAGIQSSQKKKDMSTLLEKGIHMDTNSDHVHAHAQDDTSENDTVEDRKSCQPLHSNIIRDRSFPPFNEIADDGLNQNELVQESFILHFIFRKFSNPAPSYDVVENVLEYERRRISNSVQFVHSKRRRSIHENHLVQDAVVNIGNSSVHDFMQGGNDVGHTTSLVAMILNRGIFFQLPLHFRLAFLRLLIRLLTNESDTEYDNALSLEPQKVPLKSEKGADKETKNKQKSNLTPMRDGVRISSTKSWRNEDLRHLHERNKKRHNFSYDTLYSVVRFCCSSGCPSNYIDHIDEVVHMIESLMEPLEGESRKTKSLLLGPLCRLLGLLCTAGIAPKQLRKILSLIRDDTFRMSINVHVLRALIVATEGSSLAKKLHGKASPQSFFNFGRSKGISQTIYPTSNAKSVDGWPFRSSFGMACWFRLEDFPPNYECDNPCEQNLFKICSGDGTAFSISFKMLSSSTHRSLSSKSDAAAHVVFSVRDSDKSRKTANVPLSRGIELIGCPIIPRVWFHIAIRHTKKSYLSLTKDEVTVLLDGKPMLTEQFRFPKSSSHSTETSQNKKQPLQPIDISFCSGLDAEAGSLYVFNDIVSDETFYSLYKYTSGKSESLKSLSQRSGIIATIEQKVNPLTLTSFVEEDTAIITLKKADVEEMVIPRARAPSTNGLLSSGPANNTNKTTLDLIGDDEFLNHLHNPTKGEFSRHAFVSNIYFVWDPTRVTDDNLVLEAHSSIHSHLDTRHCVPWKMRGAKDIISCVGGIQSLLPVFRSLICPEAAPKASAVNNGGETTDIGATIPLAFSLLAAFLRDADTNGREWIRCGGSEILERFIIRNKDRYANKSPSSQRHEIWMQINAFRRYHHYAEELVSVLFDLMEACSYNTHLESKISSRFLFNVDLWLGGLGKVPGTALHSVLLPALSCVTKANPDDTAHSLRTRLMMNLVREYTVIPAELNGSDRCFDSACYTKIMTKMERSHLVDVVMGMLLAVLSVEVKTSNLLPLIQFISFNLDMEWETVNNNLEHSTVGQIHIDPETRKQRFDASEKACSILVLLLQSRPAIPGLFVTLNQIVGDTISWILCCMVNRSVEVSFLIIFCLQLQNH